MEAILRVKFDILKNDETSRNTQILRMGLPGGQNVRTPQESLFTLSRGPQRPYTKQIQKYIKNIVNFIIRPMFARVGFSGD